MTRWRDRIAAAAACCMVLAAVAQSPEGDPDSPQTHRKAVDALARAQRLDMKGETLELKAETRQIEGVGRGIEASQQDIAGLLKDLNAEVRGKEVRISLEADVLFDFDKADLKPEAKPALQKVAAVLKEYPKASAAIEGHTDGKGDAAYNQKLSEGRAETVRKWFADNGVAMKLTAKGLGKTKPVAPNTTPAGKDNPEGRQKNRRVEIRMTREEVRK